MSLEARGEVTSDKVGGVEIGNMTGLQWLAMLSFLRWVLVTQMCSFYNTICALFSGSMVCFNDAS